MEPTGVCARREHEPLDAENFKNHCSLRFNPPFFAIQKAAVEAAGYEFGEGFIKLPYKRELPTELLKALMRACPRVRNSRSRLVLTADRRGVPDRRSRCA